MESLLTPVSTVYKSSDQIEKHILVEVKKPSQKAPSKPSSKASTPTEALEILRNEPDHGSLVSTLRYLRDESSDFNITLPSPLAAQLVHVLVSDVVPNYWDLLFDGKKSNARKQAKANSASELDLLLSCLRSVTGLNALLLSLKQLVQQSKEAKAAVGGPNTHDVLMILLQVLTELMKGDEFIEEISDKIWSPTAPLSNQRAIWKEFLSIVGSGKILGLAAEAEDVVNELSKKIGEKYWIADGSSYSTWLARNITHWARTLHTDSENEWKCCGEMLSKAFRLGFTGKWLVGGCGSNLTFQQKV